MLINYCSTKFGTRLVTAVSLYGDGTPGSVGVQVSVNVVCDTILVAVYEPDAPVAESVPRELESTHGLLVVLTPLIFHDTTVLLPGTTSFGFTESVPLGCG
jgi:hypothetical protein